MVGFGVSYKFLSSFNVWSRGTNTFSKAHHCANTDVGGNLFKVTTSEIREGIWRIPDGIPFRMNNMTIQTTDTDKLLVTGWTNTVHFQNVTREGTLKELGDLKDSFLALSKSFTELTDIIKLNRLTVEFHMAYDDAGKVGIGLCSEIDGKVNWYIS